MHLDFTITPQPDEATCGPACLHSVYRYYHSDISLEDVLESVTRLPDGGSLAVLLGLDALERGFDATIYTCNLHVFDPSWFTGDDAKLRDGLTRQAAGTRDGKLKLASESYLEFLDRGGRVLMDDIGRSLMQSQIDAGWPIIAGLTSTWLYRVARERDDQTADDIEGTAMGHFVVVHGIDRAAGIASIADPYLNQPSPGAHMYTVSIDRLICAILLGVVTYDAKLLLIRPRGGVEMGG